MAQIAGKNYQGRLGELHLLDNTQSSAGAAATPYGVRVIFESMDFSAGYTKRPPELPRMNRERFDAYSHLQIGSEQDLLEPVDFTFNMVLSSVDTDYIQDFVGINWANKEGGLTSDATFPWSVKGTPTAGLKTTKSRALTGDGQYKGGRIDSKGSAIRLLTLADVKKVCVDVESTWTEVDTSNRWGLRLNECHFAPGSVKVTESADFVTLAMTGMMYGEAQRITSFSRAINVMEGNNLL